MMKAKRRRHSPEFKAKVGMEALKGVKTIQQLAKEFEVHPVQVSEWKKVIVESLAGVFERGCKDLSVKVCTTHRPAALAVDGA